MTYRYAQLATRVLARPDDPVPDARDDVRARTVAAMEKALGDRRLYLRRRRFVALLSLAAAVALACGAAYRVATQRSAAPRAANGPAPTEPWMVAHPTGGGATLGAAPLSSGASLAPGSRVVARDDGRVALSLSTGTTLVVEEGGDLTVVEEGSVQRFRLDRGSIQADVAKLTRGSRFVVATPDAQIEVRGTSFRVAVVPSDPACGSGITTRVAVAEGQVAVRTESSSALVEPGHVWPSDCSDVVAAPAAHEPRPVAAFPRHLAAPPPEPSASTPPVPAWAGSASTLAEHNDLFAQAMQARRTGQADVAIERFESLLTRFPASPLAESALAEQMRLLRGRDPTRAATVAKRYLARYPSGFARTDADAALAEAR